MLERKGAKPSDKQENYKQVAIVKTAGYIECSLRRRPGWPGIIVNEKETFVQMRESREALENDLQRNNTQVRKKGRSFKKS